jgi:hypothetical protein
VRDDPVGEPFSTVSPEATFSLCEAEVGGHDVVTAAEAVDPRPALRVAAARRDRAQLVVSVEPDVVEPVRGVNVAPTRSRTAVPATGGRGDVTDRASRVAERIARRYPNALR